MALSSGKKVAKIDRLRLANSVPMMLETRFINLDLCGNILDQDLTSSLWKVFENSYGHKPFRHARTLGIIGVSRESAILLGVNQGSMVYLIKGVTYLKDGRAIECEESFYRSDK